jgi:hypothetical protein
MQSVYNPARSGDGTPAKLWELIRRNHNFNHYAKRLISLSKRSGRHRSGWYYAHKAIQVRDFTNPIATFVFRWLFRPERWNLMLPLDDNAGGLPDEGGVFEIFEAKVLLQNEKSEKTYAGPLTTAESRFSLETSWPETPPLFRLLFGWLASELEFWQKDTTNLLEPVLLTSKEIQDLPKTAGAMARIQNLFDGYDVLAIPRIPFSQKQRKEVISRVQNLLNERERLGQIVGAKKEFLGTAAEWDVFLSVYPRTDPLTGLGKSKAITELIETRKSKGEFSRCSDPGTIITDRYSKMEYLMEACWSSFGALSILLHHFFETPIRNRSFQSVIHEHVAGVQATFGGISPFERINLQLIGRIVRKLRAVDSWRTGP